MANEAALIAARRGADAVSMVDFDAASDRVIGGLEKKNKVQLATCQLLWLSTVSNSLQLACSAEFDCGKGQLW